MADRSQGILLDSSVVIAHFRGKLDLFKLTTPDEPLFLPLVALGELLKGALKSGNPAKNQGNIASFLQIVALLNPGPTTAENYAQISLMLEQKGEPIPENDIWIGAVALELNMPLATRDSHFDRIHGLSVLRW